MMKNKYKSVFEIFSQISKSHKTKDEMLELTGMSEKLFFKNLTLLKKTGFKITLSNKIYRFDNLKTTFDIENHEKNLLSALMAKISIMMPNRVLKSFQSLCKKIYSLSACENYDNLIKKYELYKMIFSSESYREKIEKFEHFIKMKQRLRITLKNREQLLIEPSYINWEESEFMLYFINLEYDFEQKYPLKDILKAAPEDMEEHFFRQKEIIFEIQGKLAKSYVLKEDERVVDYFEDKIIIASNVQNKNALYKRLLRYDVLCRVLYPKSAVKEFCDFIDSAILNIERM